MGTSIVDAVMRLSVIISDNHAENRLSMMTSFPKFKQQFCRQGVSEVGEMTKNASNTKNYSLDRIMLIIFNVLSFRVNGDLE